jgi:hypothetical protein
MKLLKQIRVMSKDWFIAVRFKSIKATPMELLTHCKAQSRTTLTMQWLIISWASLSICSITRLGLNQNGERRFACVLI